MQGEIAVLVIVAAVGLGILAARVRHGWRQGRSEATADASLAALFNGAPAVVYEAPDSTGGIDTTLLVQAATEHGYRLQSETGRRRGRRVVFERR